MSEPRLAYPPSRRSDQVDLYHGTRVADPYRWLEDPDAPESRAWIEAQNRVTREYLDGIRGRAAVRERLSQLWSHERWSVPVKEGGRYFYVKTDGLQNQGVLHVQDGLDAEPRVLLDPNPLSEDGTVALTEWEVSRDGNLLAYALSTGGSDWYEWRFRDVAIGRDRGDVLRWSKFSRVAFTPDGQGLYYSRYEAPDASSRLREANYYQKLMLHRLGTDQAEDVVVYQRPDEKEWGFDAEVTDDGRYLVVIIWRGSEEKNRVLCQDLATDGAPILDLVAEFEASFDFLGSDGPTLFFKSDLAAPRGRVVALDATRAGVAPREVIAESRDTLEQGSVVGSGFVLAYLQDARSDIRRFDLDGRPRGAVALPGLGSVLGLSGTLGDEETFYAFASFAEPGAIYRLDAATGLSSLFRAPRVDFDPADYETRQVFYPSADGTRVPMFLSHRRGLGLDRDRERPTFLYGYGGFNVSLSPWFSPSNLLWMELGGVFAVANLRGGGEYGEEWHRAGMKEKKQNVIDDFIAAAEWLVASGSTSSRHLAIGGGSNGGLLVGAALCQRPELFAAVIADVGVFDLLRYQNFTIGWAWVPELGSADDPEEFVFLHRLSPLHNLTPGTTYPATLITTADHDDRVVPAHSFKFAATLQAAQGAQGAQAAAAPVLVRIQTRAGHGLGKPTAMLIDESADRLAFLLDRLA